jgi:uncharacterized glyoxalase superfamily protein PhnB
MPIDPTRPTIYPVLTYDDADRAIAYLTETFGFTPGDVTRDDDGRIVHATLGWANQVLMLSESRGGDNPFDHKPICLYLVVDDPDAHHARAAAAGAEMVMELTDQPYGSREYAVRDAEGNVWCFGTYQPAVSAPA